MKNLIFTLCLIVVMVAGDNRTTTTKKINTPIVIDGIADPIWETIMFETGFRQEEPNPLKPATYDTKFKILYDDEHLYLFVHAVQPINTVLGQTGKRETGIHDGDEVMIFIDPMNDNTTGYVFGVTSKNVQYDGKMYNDNRFYMAWDAIWDSATKIYDDHWTVEYKIPFRTIRFQDKEVQTWGFNLERYLKSNNEFSQWQAFTPETGTRISAIGDLVGLRNLKSKNELNVLPSALSVFDNQKDYDPTNGQLMSLDLRYNLNAQNSIVATVRPDFAQIEADQDQINYSDYPTNLREKRPFFLEGNDLYQTHQSYYYSRRMAKPDLGSKLIGSTGKFKYGASYIKNDGLSYNIIEGGKTFDEKSHKEDFLFTRLKYSPNQQLELGYFGAHVNSDYEFSGQLHALDATYRPSNYFQFDGLYGTTKLEENFAYTKSGSDKNSDILLRGRYRSDLWTGSLTYQRKSDNFQQDLVGYLRLNNFSNKEVRIGRKFRFPGSVLRQVRIEYFHHKQTTINNEVPNNMDDIGITWEFQSKSLGSIRVNTGANMFHGEFRHYSYDINSNLKRIYHDNISSFVGVKEDASSYFTSISTDRSKLFRVYLSHYNTEYKHSNLNRSRMILNVKPNNQFKISIDHDRAIFDGSDYVSKITYKTTGLKLDYALTKNLFLKTYTQYSSFSEDFSNNLVFTYEYQRGNFIYLAYKEFGSINDDYKNGSLYEHYRMKRRTISLKASYSLYL